MTEAEWPAWDHPHPLLIFLRGPVDEPRPSSSFNAVGGALYPGPGEHVSPHKLVRFMAACASRLEATPFDEPFRGVLDTFLRYAADEADRPEYAEAGLRLQAAVALGHVDALPASVDATGWAPDPFGASSFAVGVAWMTAHHRARDTVAVLRAAATEDDLFEWGFGGPPDPHWQAVVAEELRDGRVAPRGRRQPLPPPPGGPSVADGGRAGAGAPR